MSVLTSRGALYALVLRGTPVALAACASPETPRVIDDAALARPDDSGRFTDMSTRLRVPEA